MQFSIGDAWEIQLRTVIKIYWECKPRGEPRGRKSSAAAGCASPLCAIRCIDSAVDCAKNAELILSGGGGSRAPANSSPRHTKPARAGVYMGTGPPTTARHPCMDVERQRVRWWALAAGENTHAVGQCRTSGQAQCPTACGPSRMVHASSMRAHLALSSCAFRLPAHGCREPIPVTVEITAGWRAGGDVGDCDAKGGRRCVPSPCSSPC